MTTNNSELTTMLAEAIEANRQLLLMLQQLVSLEVAGHEKRYVCLDTLLERLGDGFSGRRILSDLKDGYFKHGRDYIITGGGAEKPRYGFWVEGIRESYKPLPENRRKY
jgi:hypothetical protein